MRVRLLILTLFLSHLSFSQEATPLRVGLNVPVSGLFPPQSYGYADLKVMNQIFEGLVRFTNDGKNIEPALARDWHYDTTSQTITFNLRRDIYFHDDPCFADGVGREVVASDFKKCFEFLCTSDESNNMPWLLADHVKGAKEFMEATAYGEIPSEGIPSIVAVNDSTLVIELEMPGYDFLFRLAMPAASVWPWEARMKYEGKVHWHPLGTGPFRYRRTKNRVVRLEANPQYWGKGPAGETLPYIEQLTFQWWKQQEDQLAALKAGALDVCIPDHLLIPALFKESKLKSPFSSYRGSRSPYLNTGFYGFLTTDSIFRKREVRLALNYAVDRTQLIQSCLPGAATPADGGIVPPVIDGYDKVREGYRYDPERAKALLAEAGYPDGKNFPDLTLYYNRKEGGINRCVAESLRVQIQEVLNIKTQTQQLPFEDHLRMVEHGRATMWRDGWIADYPSALNYLNLFYGAEIPANPAIPSEVNPFRFSNQTFDSLFSSAASTWKKDEHHTLCAQAEILLLNEAPVLLLWYNHAYLVSRKNLSGLHQNTMNNLLFREVKRVSE